MAVILNDNEFFSGLTNLALFMRLYATNTSSTPESFVESFMTETLGSGDTKIFHWSDLPEVEDYNPESTLLSVKKVKTGEEYLKVTEKKVIRSSYNTYILDMAFTSEEGMNQFIGYLLGQMESAKTDHLYHVVIDDLFGKTFTGKKQNKSVDQYDLSTATSFTDLNNGELLNGKEIAKQVQLTLDNIQVFSTDYNGLGNKEALNVSDMKFVICEPYKTEQLLNVYATLLNSNVLTTSFHKPEMYEIPTDSIESGEDDTIGWLMHRNAYQLFYKFTFMGKFFDVSNLCINNFLHFWYGKGWLENLPVVKFSKTTKKLASSK